MESFWKDQRCLSFRRKGYLIFIFLGTLASNDLVWELSDMFNNLMVIPNALALFALTGMVQAAMKRVNKL